MCLRVSWAPWPPGQLFTLEKSIGASRAPGQLFTLEEHWAGYDIKTQPAYLDFDSTEKVLFNPHFLKEIQRVSFEGSTDPHQIHSFIEVDLNDLMVLQGVFAAGLNCQRK